MLIRTILRRSLAIATDIIPKLPAKDDPHLTTVVKVLGILESIDRLTNTASTSGLHAYFEEREALPKTNAQFVDLFFTTSLKDSFDISHKRVNDYVDIVEAHSATLGTLYFIEWHWGAVPEPSKDFWHSPGFQFDHALDELWGTYDGAIHIEIGAVETSVNRPKTTFSAIPQIHDPLLGKGEERLEKFLRKHQRFAADKKSRTYLFLGKQGTGKTTFAQRLGERMGHRILRIDSQGITTVGASNLDFLIQSLNPDLLILDDLDRCSNLGAALPTLLTTFSDFKQKHPTVTIVITANDSSKLDPALVRPGRIDDLLDFDPPDAVERQTILQGYIQGDRGKEALAAHMEAIVEATEGLTPAYLREIALQLQHSDDAGEVIHLIKRFKDLADPQAKKDEAKPAENPPKDLG